MALFRPVPPGPSFHDTALQYGATSCQGGQNPQSVGGCSRGMLVTMLLDVRCTSTIASLHQQVYDPIDMYTTLTLTLD